MDKPNNNAEKQFMIGRIQYSLNNFIEDWHYQTKSFEGLIENTFSTNRRERNAMLSACGIFIPILFGLSSIEKININPHIQIWACFLIHITCKL